MSFDEAPESIRARVIRGTVVDDTGRPQHEGAEDEPRTHHPAHVGHPVDDITGMHVGAKGHVLGSLDRKAAVGVHSTLGCTRGAGGVDDHEQVLCGGRLARRHRILRWDNVVPPVIASRYHGDLLVHASVDDNAMDGRHRLQSLIRRRLHRHGTTAAILSICREQAYGSGITQSRGDGAGAETGKQGQRHGPDSRQGEKGDDDVQGHGHEETNRVAFGKAECTQGVGTAIDFCCQLAIGQCLCGTLFELRNHSHTSGALGVGEPFVEAVGDDVEPAANAPLRELNAFVEVDDLLVGMVKANVEVLENGLRKPGHISRRSGDEFVHGSEAVTVHERLEMAALDTLGCRSPDDVFCGNATVGHGQILWLVSLAPTCTHTISSPVDGRDAILSPASAHKRNPCER